MASTYLSRTFSASPTSTKIITFSVWFKRSGLGEQHIFGNRATDNYRSHLYFDSSDRFSLLGKRPDGTGNNSINITTNRRFRDTNGWYHLVVAIDTSLATAADRVKIYVNGVLETSFAQETNPNQNDVLQLNKDLAHEIGSYDGSNYYFDGYMSHIHFIDGTQYAASAFGETDSNGVWKIKTSPSVTYGNHGFFILKDGNSVTDQSPNSNNWAVTAGTLTNDKDNPSNVFAIFNSLHNYYEGGTYAYGNNQITTGGSNKYTWNNSTIGMEAGKYYAEFKWVSGGTDILFGLTDKYTSSSTGELGNYDKQYAYRTNGTVRNNNGNLSGWSGSTWTTGDVVGVAYDATNGKLYFSKNGTWQNSGDPTSGSTGTGAISVSASPQDGCYYFSSCGYDDASCVLQANFGNGRFGTTAVSSAGTNASNNGVFEYDVPTGYTALCTKGLNL
tara:strand:- start:1273 stop:2604 length:1332 start_codon:yes stop_codon:yes gene_type:complete